MGIFKILFNGREHTAQSQGEAIAKAENLGGGTVKDKQGNTVYTQRQKVYDIKDAKKRK